MRAGALAAALVLVATATVLAQPPIDIERVLAERVRRTPNYRASYRGPATWWTRPAAVWAIQPEARCHQRLRDAGVRFRPMRWTPAPVPSPVEILGPVGGVSFRKTRPVPLYVSCELALRLPLVARALRDQGAHEAEVMSALRREPLSSFHSAGLALDLSAFHTARGTISVEEHFVLTPDEPTCEAPEPEDWRARALRSIACDLARSERFSTVLTPNYGRGHHDHLHIDARPADPRIFVR